MRRMGFSYDPGLLPFTTVRRQEWANRLTLGENVEIHGEHGCTMPPMAAKVVSIEACSTCPAELASVYAGKQLVAIALEQTDEPWRKIGESWHKVIRREFDDTRLRVMTDEGIKIIE